MVLITTDDERLISLIDTATGGEIAADDKGPNKVGEDNPGELCSTVRLEVNTIDGERLSSPLESPTKDESTSDDETSTDPTEGNTVLR